MNQLSKVFCHADVPYLNLSAKFLWSGGPSRIKSGKSKSKLEKCEEVHEP